MKVGVQEDQVDALVLKIRLTNNLLISILNNNFKQLIKTVHPMDMSNKFSMVNRLSIQM